MRGFVAVAKREIAERRSVFAAAAVLGLLHTHRDLGLVAKGLPIRLGGRSLHGPSQRAADPTPSLRTLRPQSASTANSDEANMAAENRFASSEIPPKAVGDAPFRSSRLRSQRSATTNAKHPLATSTPTSGAMGSRQPVQTIAPTPAKANMGRTMPSGTIARLARCAPRSMAWLSRVRAIIGTSSSIASQAGAALCPAGKK